MKNNHLTYFKIENFKKFDSLEVNDIGQFNLIVGDNNVGKTCLLEALLFDEDSQQLLNNFYLALTKRGLKFQIEKITREINGISTTETVYPKENYFKEYVFGKFENKVKIFDRKNQFTEISIIDDFELASFLTRPKNLPDYNNVKPTENKVGLKSEKEDIKDSYNIKGFNFSLSEYAKYGVFISANRKGHFFSIYDYDENILNFPLISFNDTPLEEESRGIYENLKTKREKKILIDVLKVVNSNIVDIELRENYNDLKSVFLISFEDKDEFVPLNFLGDGFKRIFYIVLKALSLKGKRILIDEFEIGIHHSKMKDFWVNIMKVCKELDVQLFATTHSQECIEAYSEASKELNERDIRLIRLQENKDKSIKAICLKEEYIEYMVESNTEER
ncbi:ATP-binding protein [Flavobacterium sp. PL002]|uniref:AAA family ATPase n=1 Tax=Flavobacterium sp. PL002 TaxID=1897058 RepID=UPI001787CF9A|nr:ATP/GTP phosphatase [Flavobacterium sp. PL002]